MKAPFLIKPLKFLLFLTGILLLINLRSQAQSGVLDSIKNKFAGFAEKAFQEKLFLHVDKSFYVTGDVLWFKAYVVDASSNKPTDLSKVAYVEVIDTLNNSVLQAKISLKNGLGNGSFVLPVSLNSGNYIIRAYTNWMKNYSPDYYFTEFITIVNPKKRLEVNTAGNSEKPDIQFFPEGGNLVNQLRSKVAFKVTDSGNKGRAFKGHIIDQNNDTIVSFQPLRNGMGEFSFRPESGKTYRSVLYINNKKIIRDLPKIYPAGYVLSVSEINPQQIQIQVNCTENFGNQTVYLLIHTRQVIKIALSASFNNNQLVFNIEKNKLGDGISHITLFDSHKQPIAERLYFKQPQNKLILHANAPAKSYAPRQKVEIELSSADQNNKGLSSNLSVAVYRQDSLPALQHQQIQAWLWLTSDLKGNIENAGDYFTSEGPENDKALDILMLTQGWRRFDWGKVFNNSNQAFSYIPEYEGHIISGKIRNKETGSAAVGMNTFLSSPGKRVQFYHAKSDELGKVSFFTKDFYMQNEIVLQNDFSADSIYQIEISNPFSNSFSGHRIPEFNLKPSNNSGLKIYHVNNQIQNLYSERQNKFFVPNIDSTAFFGPADVRYPLDDYTRFITMEEVLKEYITEISLQRKRKKAFIKVAFSHQKGLYENNPLLLIDGVPFFDVDKMLAFDPLKVKEIQIVNHRYLYGGLVVDGVLNFETYKNDLAGFELDPRSLILDYEGLQLKREFYSPVYQTDKEKNSRLPDFRNLLFWSSDVQTDGSGKAEFDFYTSDQPGNYIMMIQGISSGGHAGSISEVLHVRK